MSNDYKIRIITEADKAGLQGVSKELGKTTEETKKLDDAQKKAGESTKGFAKEHKGLLDGFKKLGAEVPLLGAAFNTLKNPYTALAAGIAILVVKLKEFVDAVSDAAVKAQGLDRFNGIVRNFNTLVAEQRARKNDLAEQLAKIGSNAQNAQEKLKSANEQIERTLRLEGNEDTANKANEIAKVERDVEQGVITEQEGVRRKAAIDAKYIVRAQDRETRKAAGTVTAIGNAKRLAQESAFALESQLPTLEQDLALKKTALEEAQQQEANFTGAGVLFRGKGLPIDEALRVRSELMNQSPHKDPFVNKTREESIAMLNAGIEQYRNTADIQRSKTVSAQSAFNIASGRVDATGRAIVEARTTADVLGTQFKSAAAAANQELESGRRVSKTELNTIGINADNEANAISQKEAAKIQAEIAEKMKATLESLGKANNASSDIMKAAENLFNQAKAAAASGT